MLTMVLSIEGELSLQSSTEWEGSAEQTLLCLSLPGLLLLGTSSRLGALVPVWEHRAALPEIPKGSLPPGLPTASPPISISLPPHPSVTHSSNLSSNLCPWQGEEYQRQLREAPGHWGAAEQQPW